MALIRALVTDIEGTTSALSVLKQVLAPYARANLAGFLAEERERPEVRAALEETRRQAEEPHADAARTLAILLRWIDEDRKAPPLKLLQGLVWERGYHEGSLRGHLYPDVVPALRALKAGGLELYVYSSGSAHAQRLFFQHSSEGDVRALFEGHFDTRVGAKTEPESYRAIARTLGLLPESLLFLSDAESELRAAEAAGWHALGVVREGNPPLTRQRGVIDSFAQISSQGLPLRTPSTPSPNTEELIAFVHHCHARGWAEATSGNFSLRLGADLIAITASGRDKGSLSAADIVRVDEQGALREGAGLPSAETPLHCALYRARPELGAIAHTHSRATTLLSRRAVSAGVVRLRGYEMQKAIAGFHSHEQVLSLPVVENAQDMAVLGRRVERALAAQPEAPAYLVAGHGLTTWAQDLCTLRRQLEALEFLLECAWQESDVRS